MVSKDFGWMYAPFPGGDPKENEKDNKEGDMDGELGQQESRAIGGLH